MLKKVTSLSSFVQFSFLQVYLYCKQLSEVFKVEYRTVFTEIQNRKKILLVSDSVTDQRSFEMVSFWLSYNIYTITIHIFLLFTPTAVHKVPCTAECS